MILANSFFDTSLYTYFLLPFLIFLSRIMDVTKMCIRDRHTTGSMAQ